MANATAHRVGAVNNGSDKSELFMKVYGGEVLTAFEEANKTLDKQMIRSIPHGKSASFPMSWKVSANYHTPGTELVGQTSVNAEKLITIDDQLIADVFIPNIDEAMNHYDYRSVYSAEAGRALANTWDKNTLQTGVLAARSSTALTGGNGGTVLTSATTLYRTSATDLAAGIYAAALAMDEKDVPDEEGGMPRWAFLRPAQYSLLAQKTDLYNTQTAAGNGNYADGKVLRIGGVILVKTNHLPITNIATGATKYQGDFSKTAALVMNQHAVGTVKLMDLATEMAWDIRRQGTLLLAKYAIGTGVLRADCAVELKIT